MTLPKLGGFWLLPPRDFPHRNESHPMDHDSDSSGHTESKPDTRFDPTLLFFTELVHVGLLIYLATKRSEVKINTGGKV